MSYVLHYRHYETRKDVSHKYPADGTFSRDGLYRSLEEAIDAAITFEANCEADHVAIVRRFDPSRKNGLGVVLWGRQGDNWEDGVEAASHLAEKRDRATRPDQETGDVQ